MIPNSVLEKLYSAMLRIRKFEEKVGRQVSRGLIRTPCHLYIGQEAVAAGVCLALKRGDYVFSNHRCHGHYLARGGSMPKLMAELYGKASGCSKGKGGSMHIIAPEVYFMGSSAIVAGTIPLSVGAALACSMRNIKRVSAVFFGDGAVDEGTFYESLNFASLYKLPVIFICENNLYSSHLHISKRQANVNIHQKARMFNMDSIQIDGNNVLEVYERTKEVAKKVRNGNGPALIECLTYRWRGHVGPNLDLDKGLRNRAELEYWLKRCPIKILENTLVEKRILSMPKKKQIIKNIEREIKESIQFAATSRFPNKNELFKGIFR